MIDDANTVVHRCRFGPEVATDKLLREACLWPYAHHYQTPERVD